MLDKLYQRTGIKLTERQVQLVKKLIKFLIALAVGFLILGGTLLLTHQLSPDCGMNYSQGFHIQSMALSCYSSTESRLPLVGYAVFGLLVGIAGLRFVISVVMYAVRLLTNKDYRESEMSQSVSYVESDEREQLITTRATHRAYMVLNFTLLVGWFLSLLSGHLNTAILLFIIQLIGTLSFRKEVSK
jgi:hypothetical protein